MKTVYKLSTLAALLAANTTGLLADPVESVMDSAFAKIEESVPGKFSINSRLRYEIFDLDNIGGIIGADGGSSDRDGTSLRVRYGYMTPKFGGFAAMVEGETLTRVGGDPEDIHFLDNLGDGTDINQAWIQYENADYGSVKLGRQIYTLDDHRFIGHVGWRQNIQTFDGVTAAFTGVDKLSVKAFYFDAVNRVNDDYFVLDASGINISYQFAPAFKLTGFYYSIDDSDNAGWETDTIGLRANGKFSLGEQSFVYAASLAEQEIERADDAAYLAGDLSTVVSVLIIGGGFEILDPGFRTPLATVHKFNGFADALLPVGGFNNGLEDFYAYAAYTIPVGKGIKTKVIYHWFDSESGAAPGEDGGTELDLVASYQINKYLTLVGKYGDYQEDGGVGNAGAFDKKMFTFEMNFKY